MKISNISDSITVIELSPQEVSKYHISFEAEDYNTPFSRNALWTLIQEAERLSGKALKIDSLLEIDFMPDIKGGCLMIISEGTESTSFSSEKLYESDSIDSIIDFSNAILSFKNTFPCDLYRRENFYFLISDNFDSATDILAKEYCLKISDNPIEIESIKEGCSAIIKGSALEILGGAFSKK